MIKYGYILFHTLFIFVSNGIVGRLFTIIKVNVWFSKIISYIQLPHKYGINFFLYFKWNGFYNDVFCSSKAIFD